MGGGESKSKVNLGIGDFIELNSVLSLLKFWNSDLKVKKILKLSNNCRKLSKVSKSTKKVYGILKLMLD